MAKKKTNKKSRKNNGRSAKTPDQILAEAKVKRKNNLKETLDKVYNSVDLATTGCEITVCRCACCRVAMPQMNYCEFVQMVTNLWNSSENNRKTEIICKSIEYFFKNEYEKWGMDHLIKPCQFVDKVGRCTVYNDRPLSCRTFGLWPEEEYENRVSKFEEAYKEYGLTRDDLPLSKQCKMIRRADGSTELTMDELNKLFGSLDKIDKTVGGFTDLQIKNKENYRTFHDWLLLKIFGEEWLTQLTTFMMSATREQMEDLLVSLHDVVEEKLKSGDLEIDGKL